MMDTIIEILHSKTGLMVAVIFALLLVASTILFLMQKFNKKSYKELSQRISSWWSYLL